MVNGQAAIAAVKFNWGYIGCDIDEDYVKLAEKRIKEFVIEFKSPTRFDDFE